MRDERTANYICGEATGKVLLLVALSIPTVPIVPLLRDSRAGAPRQWVSSTPATPDLQLAQYLDPELRLEPHSWITTDPLHPSGVQHWAVC